MNSTAKYTTLAAWPLAICRALEAQSIDPDPLLAQAQLNRDDFIAHPDGRVDVQLMTRFWDLVLKTTGDESFGLAVPKYVQPMHFRALGLLMLTTDTLESGLLKLGQYAPMVSNSVTIHVEQTPDLIGFCINPIHGVDISVMAVDSFYGTLVAFANQLGAQPDCIERLELLRQKPASPSKWELFFNAPILFNAKQNCLWVKREKLNNSAVMGDEKMAAYNESVVQNYVKELETESFSNKVKHLVLAQLEKGEPSINDIAEQLKVTDRSLRRHLQEENTSYRDILQQCRMGMAEHYLLKTDLSITDIALRLGFADASNFTRAFSRWFNKSPSQFRSDRL
jgi:AraC-like DNA-binding protein